MTPVQLATAECPNRLPDGGCLYAPIADNGSTPYCKPLARCLLTESQPCRYFEECILPMADWSGDAVRARAYRDAAQRYRRDRLAGKKAPTMAQEGPWLPLGRVDRPDSQNYRSREGRTE